VSWATIDFILANKRNEYLLRMYVENHETVFHVDQSFMLSKVCNDDDDDGDDDDDDDDDMVYRYKPCGDNGSLV
jgi:hypothetical protein